MATNTTTITIGQDSKGWKAIIIEGPGTREADQKTIIRLATPKNPADPDAELIAQLPEQYRAAIAADKLWPIIVYGLEGLKD